MLPVWHWCGRVQHKCAIVLACWTSPSCQSMLKCSAAKTPLPPTPSLPWLKTKSTRTQYFHNFWDLLPGGEGGERVEAEQPQPAGLILLIYALELVSLGKPEQAGAVVPAFPCRRSIHSGRCESSWGVRVRGCQKTAGVTGYLGSTHQLWCSLFYVSVFRDWTQSVFCVQNPGGLEIPIPLNLQISVDSGWNLSYSIISMKPELWFVAGE